MNRYLLILLICLVTSAAKAQTPDSVKVEAGSFTAVQKMATFPGGVPAFYQYLGQNIRYPQKARKDGIQGKVIMGFVVEADGTLSEVKVLEGLSKEINEEAIRVIKASPKWEPAIQNDKPVRQLYAMPINFSLHK